MSWGFKKWEFLEVLEKEDFQLKETDWAKSIHWGMGYIYYDEQTVQITGKGEISERNVDEKTG